MSGEPPRVPQLASASAVAERMMVDECTITRDVAGVTDDVLDLDTLKLSKPEADSSEVYAGPCMVSPATTVERVGEEIGRLVSGRRYGVRIPVSAPAVKPGDRLTVTLSQRDPGLEGRPLRVESIVRQTLAVTRQLVVIEVDQS